MIRDYSLLERLSLISDDILIGIEEVAAITGFARLTVQQRRIKDFPQPLSGVRRLKWRLGDVRAWIRSRTQQTADGSRRKKVSA